MAKCDFCGATIIFNARKFGEMRFCSDICRQRGILISRSSQIPANIIEQQVWSIHQGRCPNCGGSGPVDVHVSHRVWSALVMTSWSSLPRISCRSCGIKHQLGDAVFCLFLGWWGFPWGLLVTPIQIGRNIVGAARSPDPTKPSPLLSRNIRLHLAAQINSQQSARPDA